MQGDATAEKPAELQASEVEAAAGLLHEGILPALRRYLIEGSLPEGARVPERQLCEEMGVSRTPMREALKVLASEGLIELLPNRGARVRSYSDTDISELFEVLGGLGALAGRLACQRINDDELSAIEKLHFSMYSAYMQRDLSTYFSLNQQIHRAILKATGNRALEQAYANYSAQIQRFRYAANRGKKVDRWGEAMREHELILDALRRRDGSELSDILYRHLVNKRDAAIRQRQSAEA